MGIPSRFQTGVAGPDLDACLLQSRSMQPEDRGALFQKLFENAPDAIFIEDQAGNVLECNPAAAGLHGIPREEIIGKNATELVPPEYRSRIVAFGSNVRR